MKVSELIEKLKKFDPDSLTVIGGFNEEAMLILKGLRSFI